MKPAFYLENKDIPDVDFSQPQKGNPGCGGTEYLFAATPYYMMKEKSVLIETPLLLANHTQALPAGLDCAQVEDVYEAARRAKASGADVFVYRPRRGAEEDILDLVNDLALPTIGWAHITPKPHYLRKMAKTMCFQALVCVEHEQYDQAQDTTLAAYGKLTYIVNGFDVAQFRLENPPEKDEKLVAYLGALVPQKGFHLLAKVWPQVLKRCPAAKLCVMGSGTLYDAHARLGPWGVADSRYEEGYIIPWLSGPEGKPHPSVTFMGKVGEEKKEILYRALIGVPNPTGITENCPGSALEFQACGTAVVSGAYWGMLDTIEDGVTGLLGRSEDDLTAHICMLLENPQKARALGQNGVRFVTARYNWHTVVREWENMFSSIAAQKGVRRKPFKPNYGRHYKTLIILNRLVQFTLGRVMFWPTTMEMRLWLYTLARRAQSFFKSDYFTTWGARRSRRRK